MMEEEMDLYVKSDLEYHKRTEIKNDFSFMFNLMTDPGNYNSDNSFYLKDTVDDEVSYIKEEFNSTPIGICKEGVCYKPAGYYSSEEFVGLVCEDNSTGERYWTHIPYKYWLGYAIYQKKK